MLKSNNFNSIIDNLSDLPPAQIEDLRPETMAMAAEAPQSAADDLNLPPIAHMQEDLAMETIEAGNAQFVSNNTSASINVQATATTKPASGDTMETSACSSSSTSLASMQLAAGMLQTFAPPLAKARGHLKELIGKQNKIYIDLSAEKFKLDSSEMAKLHDMMTDVKLYRDKLLKIKKQMQNIYQRTKTMKKRSLQIQASKEKELQRKLQKQQQEEALIAKPQ